MNLFNVDGLFYKFISKITDLLILTVMWIICCIPIFTIGVATTAVFSVTLKMVKNEESYVIKSYIKGLKENFKKATCIWLIYLTFGLIWGYAFYLYFYAMAGMLPPFFIGILFLIAFIYLISILYVFPLTARYENTIKQTIKNTVLIAFRYSFRTLQMFFVIIILIAIGMWNLHTILFAILIGGGTIMFILSYFFRVIFDHIEAHFEEEKEARLNKGRYIEDADEEDDAKEDDTKEADTKEDDTKEDDTKEDYAKEDDTKEDDTKKDNTEDKDDKNSDGNDK